MENKQYISPVGSDFTEFIKTDEDLEKFNQLCAAQIRTIDVPLKECLGDVVLALKLGNEHSANLLH